MSSIAPGRGVYCNRTLNLRSIKVIGYDMDYTLVHYHVAVWEKHAYEHLRSKLGAKGWPVDGLEFDAELVVRGLVIDTELGNLLKANRFGYVKTAFHGTRQLPHEEVRKAYMRAFVDLRDDRFRFLNSLFALSEGCMYAQCVDKLDEGRIPDEHIGYRELYERVRASVDLTHTEGELKADIMARPENYVELDADTVLALVDQKRAGRRLVLITNSEWSYTLAMMSYAFDRFLPDGMTWRDLFETTVCAARKPSFFSSRAQFLRVVTDAGLLEPQVGKLEPNGCYFGGNAPDLEKHLGVSGDEILYLGDHMYGDVHVSKSALRWRTGLILRELEEELAAVEKMRPTQLDLAELMHEKETIERQHYECRLSLQRLREGYGPQPHDPEKRLVSRMRTLRNSIVALDEKIAPIARSASRAHNERWGLMMRAGNDKSHLAHQIERYADLYTSRVSNLLRVTPFAFLRSARGSLPHDPVPLSRRRS